MYQGAKPVHKVPAKGLLNRGPSHQGARLIDLTDHPLQNTLTPRSFLQGMPGLRPPAKPELPETPFGHSSIPQTGSGQQRAAPNRLTNRDSERWYRQPPIMEDQEQQQQDANKVLQNFSSRDSERLPRDRDLGSRSQLGSRESVRTGEFPSKGSTRASSANSRCPFLPCPSCVESCFETQDDQQHYRPSWVSSLFREV